LPIKYVTFRNSLRNTSKALEPFVGRSYVAIWYWIQEFNPKDVFPNKNKSRITAYIIDETMVQIGYTGIPQTIKNVTTTIAATPSSVPVPTPKPLLPTSPKPITPPSENPPQEAPIPGLP
jgi:hypothetical protein